MANVERVKKAIRIMIRVRNRKDKFDMTDWQRYAGSECCKTEQTLHQCGTAACFAGWLAVSPEFQEDGGEVGENGMPVYYGDAGSWAIANYLGINFDEAYLLCGMSDLAAEQFYGVSRTEVTPQMVIDKLQELIDHGKH